MKVGIRPLFATVLLLTNLDLQLSAVFAQGTAFTYQGRLNNGSSLASGSYDLTFTLFATNTSGVAIAGPVTNGTIAVSNGLFTTTIDFGPGVFTGSSNWLEIGVRTNGNGSFTTLAPRQQITPTPYAITAVNLAGVVANNVVDGALFDTVAGGKGNTANGNFYATVGGGIGNTSIGYGATVGGGFYNTNTGAFATVGGGMENTASGGGSFIGGGGYDGTTAAGNMASGAASSVVGGLGNMASGDYATVGGGAR